MKQKDIALIIFCAGCSAILALIVANFVFGGTSHETEVETVQELTSEFVLPDSKYFNSESINPTQPIGGIDVDSVAPPDATQNNDSQQGQ